MLKLKSNWNMHHCSLIIVGRCGCQYNDLTVILFVVVHIIAVYMILDTDMTLK